MNYLFDLFGTLVTNNIAVHDKLMTEPFGIDYRGYQERIRDFVSTRNFPTSEIALDSLLNHLGMELSQEDKSDFLSGLNSWKNSLELHSGACFVLTELRKRGSKIAVVSNINTLIEDVPKKYGLYKHVDVVVMSHRAGYAKPSKEIYYLALNKLNLTPSEATMIGDKLENDVLVPISLGMNAILFDPTDQCQNYRGRKIKSLKEILS
jgi:HAD superfamily hydrolase (TIGR01509 family)